MCSKERDGFLRDLQHFHETRGTPFRRGPVIGGKEVDLHLLYTLVTGLGGWIKVNSKNGWTDILDQLRLPKDCVNGSVALKQIYLRYLDRWEKVHFLGEEADRGSDDDEESRHKRWSARSLHSVPLTYNYTQHSVADANREYNHLSTNLYKSSDYDRLALSLISPLPNEQDFAINVCTLLSNDGKHTLKLERHPRMVDYLLAHAGVFCHSSLRRLFYHSYTQVRKHPNHKFWSEVLECKEFLDLTDENSPLTLEPADSKPIDPLHVIIEEPVNQHFEINPNDAELFCLGRGLGTLDYIGQRVLQVTTILRNLSFIEENVPVLLQNKTFLRFLLLCISSRWGHLRNLGMDMLGNIALDFPVKEYPNDRLSVVLLEVVMKGLKSEDRTLCLSSLEVLNKLSQNEINEDVLLRHLEADVYERVCSFLTIHDVMLLIYTLECLYSLSSLGERSCNLIVCNHGVVDTLVSLVTVEGKSYGPKACIGMKLVETVPGGATTSATTSTQSALAPSVSSSAVTASSGSSATTSTTLTTLTSSSKLSASSPQTTPVRAVQIAPQRLVAITPSSVSVATVAAPSAVAVPTTASSTATLSSMTPQQLIQQQHAHQQAIHENEQFALAWLRATYEPCGNGRIEHQELYKHYLNSCSKIGRRGVISPLHFPRCVRSVFGGTVGPNPSKQSTSSEAQYYEGIKVMAHPHLSQALLGASGGAPTPTSLQQQASSSKEQAGQSNTSLIKSLLATKVNDCMTTVSMRTATDCQNVAQVAARQQKLLAQQTEKTTPVKSEPHKSRLNGARQLFADDAVGDPSVSSTTPFAALKGGKKEPPQPPPPLAPLSNNKKGGNARIDNEDSDSTGNNSLASSSGMGTIGVGGISSTEEGENSLTSFEGLLNGIPNLENPLNEDSNSKDSVMKAGGGGVEILKNKPLRLADLLEKKVEKTPTAMMNGTLGKELRLDDLVENHIEKALSDHPHSEDSSVNRTPLKRPLPAPSPVEPESKKAKLSVNGSVSSPAPDSVSSSDDSAAVATATTTAPTTSVSNAAAKLFADMAADILEGEDEEEQMIQEPAQVEQQLVVENNQQMLLQPRQIIVSSQQAKAAPPQGQTVIVQNTAQPRPIVPGQILLSQGLQGQVQLVASTTQPGQYVLQTTGSAQPTYVVAQPQTAVVHGQPQTVLVAQQPGGAVGTTKTIIILQQQPAASQQKMVLPQGQQVVVTQMHRPVLQSSSVATPTVIKVATSNGTVEKKEEPKPRIIRDLSTPFVCEWGECNLETKFKSANQVYLHVCEAHVPTTGTEEIVCQWERCDNMKRKRFSLMTHLHDKHCNTEAMKQSLTRRKQVSQGGKVEPPPPTPTSHPGYAPDAALHAIKRHALEFVNPKELQDDNEGPVTKSIRLTASLILRNLVIYSSNCRRYLKHYEPHLANVALSNVESSRTIAQVLYDMNEGSTHR